MLLRAEEASLAEPGKLTDLRDAWTQAKVRGARPIKEKYLEALIALRDRYTKQSRLGDAVLVRDEIKVLTEGREREKELDGEGAAPAELAALRATYDREIERMEAVNDRKYVAALKTMQRGFTTKGDLESVLAVKAELGRVEGRSESADGEHKYAAIELTSSIPNISVEKLEVGVERLSGGYRPTFSKVNEELEGTHFLRAPWQANHTLKVRAASSGAVLALSPSRLDFEGTKLEWKRSANLVEGAYIKYVYQAQVKRGDEFELSGGELSLVAKGIVLRK